MPGQKATHPHPLARQHGSARWRGCAGLHVCMSAARLHATLRTPHHSSLISSTRSCCWSAQPRSLVQLPAPWRQRGSSLAPRSVAHYCIWLIVREVRTWRSCWDAGLDYEYAARMQMPVEDLALSFVSASEPQSLDSPHIFSPHIASYRPPSARHLLIFQQTLTLPEVGNGPRESQVRPPSCEPRIHPSVNEYRHTDKDESFLFDPRQILHATTEHATLISGGATCQL